MQKVFSEKRSAAFVCTLDILHLIIDIQHFWHDFLGSTKNLSMISSQKNLFLGEETIVKNFFHYKDPFLQWGVSMDVNVLHGTIDANKEPVFKRVACFVRTN